MKILLKNIIHFEVETLPTTIIWLLSIRIACNAYDKFSRISIETQFELKHKAENVRTYDTSV